MPLQTSGTITLAQIQTEFGGSNPIGLSEYYRGGGLVPNTAANASIPTSGIIRLSNFYGGSNVVFTPVTRTYTTGTAATETAPTGATNVIIAVWGGGGGGAGGWFSDSDEAGGGGGAGGYSQSSYSITGGQTLIYTVGSFGIGGSYGNAGLSNGANSSVSSGTKSITTMIGNGGIRGILIDGGAGGSASGGTTTNTSGGSGGIPDPGTNVIGFNSNVGGGGGNGGFGGAGGDGAAGKIIFYYT